MEMAIANQEGTSPRVKNFESCRKIAQGPVFIIASGKSAKDFPLEQFSDIPIITMNGAIAMFAGSDIKPFSMSARILVFACNNLTSMKWRSSAQSE